MDHLIAKPFLLIIRIVAIIFFSIGSVALGGYAAFMTYQTIFAVPVVQVPSVRNMDLDSARQLLYKTGLKVVISSDNVFEQGEQYIVTSQNPVAGTKIKKNRSVEVEIKATKTLQQVPDLYGKTIEEAKMLLAEIGYQIGDIAYSFHQQLPEGRIIAQTPPAGANKTDGDRINILISKGTY